MAEIEDLRSKSPLEDVFDQYKKNVRIFIDAVKNEVSELIDKYEQVLQTLKDENIRLREEQSPIKQFVRTGVKQNPSRMTNYSEPISPVKTSNPIDMLQTAKSNMFTPFGSNNKLGEIKLSSIMAKRQTYDDFNFPVELIGNEPEQHNMSRFECNSRIKKQKEEDIIHFL